MSARPVSPGAIRAWARSKGIAVGLRGRLHPDVIAQYNARDKDDVTVVAAPKLDLKLSKEDMDALAFMKPTGKRFRKWTCGFCGSGNHERCPGSIRNGSACDVPFVTCRCFTRKPDRHPVAIQLD